MIVATRRLTVVTSAPNRKGAWLTECNRAEGEIRPQEEQTRHKRHETASVLFMNLRLRVESKIFFFFANGLVGDQLVIAMTNVSGVPPPPLGLCRECCSGASVGRSRAHRCRGATTDSTRSRRRSTDTGGGGWLASRLFAVAARAVG